MSVALTPARFETGCWLILCIGLAAGIGLETKWGSQMQRPLPLTADTPPDFPRPALTEAFHLPPPDHYAQFTARPIFNVTRRPAPLAPSAERPKPGMKKQQFILMGTTFADDSKFAFLVQKATNKSHVVAQGRQVNGITVREVLTDRVVLSQFDDTETLVLRTNKPTPAEPSVPVGTQAAAPPIGAPAISAAPGVPALPPESPGSMQSVSPAITGASATTAVPPAAPVAPLRWPVAVPLDDGR